MDFIARMIIAISAITGKYKERIDIDKKVLEYCDVFWRLGLFTGVMVGIAGTMLATWIIAVVRQASL